MLQRVVRGSDMPPRPSPLWIRFAGILLAFDGLILLWIGLAVVTALSVYLPVGRAAALTDWLLALAFCLAGAIAIAAAVQSIRLRRTARLPGLAVGVATTALLLGPFLVGSPIRSDELGMLLAALLMQVAIVI